MPRNPEVEKTLKALESATVEVILNAHPAVLPVSAAISDALMRLLEGHDQAVALAICLGTLHAAAEPNTCEADKYGAFVTMEDRMDIFLAIYRIVYADAVRINAAVAKHIKAQGN